MINQLSEHQHQHKKGGLKKISGFKPLCMSPEHNPPQFISLEPGGYTYTCPACGNTTSFFVPAITA